MGLQNELGLTKPFRHSGHETLLNVVITSQLLLKEAQTLLNTYDLTVSQFNVLLMLKVQGVDGRLNQTQLGNLVVSKRSGVSGLIDRMEQAGLVKRVPDPEDRRVNLVEMTANGREKLEKAEQPYIERINELTSVITADEHHQLRSILEKIRLKTAQSAS